MPERRRNSIEVERRSFPGGVTGYRAPAGMGFDVWVYRVGRLLVDSGAPRLVAAMLPRILEDGPVERIWISHHHEDHAGGAPLIRAATGARAWTHAWTAPLVQSGFRVRPYQRRLFGRFRPWVPDAVLDLPARGRSVWDVPEGRFEVLHVPGHSHDMSVLWWPENRILFSADLYLGRRLRAMRRDESFPELADSVARVLRETSPRHLLCTHNPVTGQGVAALRAKHAFLQRSARRIEGLRRRGLDRDRVARELLGTPHWRMAAFSLGDVMGRHLVASAEGDFRPRPDVLRVCGPAAAYRFDATD